MSELIDWIKERRTIHNAATEGSWGSHDCEPCACRGSEDLSIWRDDDPVAQWLDSDNPNQRADRDAIVDAHNTLPATLTALEKVLELHKPERLYSRLLDHSWVVCPTCSEHYPCPTVQAIEGAINE